MAKPPRENDQGPDASRPTEDQETRPGAYVEMVSTPRRRRSAGSLAPHGEGYAVAHPTEQIRLPSGAVAYVSQPVPRAHGTHGPMGLPGSDPPALDSPSPRSAEVRLDRADDTRLSAYGAPKAITEVMIPAREDARAEAENTNRRADITIARASSVRPGPSVPLPRVSQPPPAASVLDAKPQFHSDPPPTTQTPWGVLIAVAVLSAIITAALVVFVIESRTAKRGEVHASTESASAPPSMGGAAPAAARAGAVVAPSISAPLIVPSAAATDSSSAAPAASKVVEKSRTSRRAGSSESKHAPDTAKGDGTIAANEVETTAPRAREAASAPAEPTVTPTREVTTPSFASGEIPDNPF